MKDACTTARDLCQDRLRFTIATVEGRLVFTEIEVNPVDQACRQNVAELKRFLMNKALDDVRHEDLAAFKCHGNAACFDAIVDALTEDIEFFKPGSHA